MVGMGHRLQCEMSDLPNHIFPNPTHYVQVHLN